MSDGGWAYRAPRGPSSSGSGDGPTVAVLIAAYNAAPWLTECLDSVFAQTHPADQIVVCDDGSTDDTSPVLARYAGRIDVINQANGGEGAAKNAALQAATTDYVAFLDADDRFASHRLEAVMWLARQRPDLDVIVTDIAEFGPHARRFSSLTNEFSVDDQRLMLLRRNALPVFVARRTALLATGGFATDRSLHRDWLTATRMVFAGAVAGAIAETLYEYRRFDEQTTSDRVQYYRQRLATLAAFRTEFVLSPPEAAAVASAEYETFERLWHAERVDDVVSLRTTLAVLRRPTSSRVRARAAVYLPLLGLRRIRALWLRGSEPVGSRGRDDRAQPA